MRIQTNNSLNILSYLHDESLIELTEEGTEIFNQIILDFLTELSKSLINDTELRKHSELVSFAFYCRQANLNKLKHQFTQSRDFRIGKGIVFHITPGNVPMNFAYSLLSAMLSGNSSIVRVPTREFIEVVILISRINSLLKRERFKEVLQRVLIVRYDSSTEWTSYFSQKCDVRVIWGGNDTINNIRRNPIKPSANEVTFYDRFSVSVFSAKAIVDASSLNQLASNFFIDTLFYDQNACTSPKQIFWLGDKETIRKAKNRFWGKFELELRNRQYSFPVNSSVSKLCTVMEKLATGELRDSQISLTEGFPLSRIPLSYKTEFDEDDYVKAGLFFETSIDELAEIDYFLSSNCQTLSYYGLERSDLEAFVATVRPQIDRVVPVGRTMEWSFIWDGYNLINTLSRIIAIL